ncbi:MAG: DoxX family protein [Saprospiraceae bacterium]
MTLSTLIISFAILALILTISFSKWLIKPQSWLMTFLQNFCGVWFIFSGLVKAVDPMGTAFKMDQYFAAFEQTFKPTWFSFIAPVFPFMAKYAVSFSLGMIILEILLGVALIIGFAPKWTSRIFFILLVFFTVLTGFTYLTGYVPSNKNFFDFSAWGSYDKNQMRVSDCGCFGDFLKLDPKISFFKDLFLLIPGVLFLVFGKVKHQLWTPGIRFGIMIASLIGISLFSWKNTFQNEPMWDFRPFKNGADIRTTRENELAAAQQVKIEFAEATNKSTKEKVRIPYADYMKEFKKYPKESWETKFIYGESKIKRTKVSDYQIMDMHGADITVELLKEPGYSLMINAYKIHGSSITEKFIKVDSLFEDSVRIIKKDTIRLRKFIRLDSLTKDVDRFIPDPQDVSIFTDKINPLVDQLHQDGIKIYAVTGGLGEAHIQDFSNAIKATYPVYQADDITLKTVMRSNPGLILWKDGKIIEKWHYKHLPSSATLRDLIKKN